MKVLQADNEDNALIAQRVIFELHKAYRPHTESQVQVSTCINRILFLCCYHHPCLFICFLQDFLNFVQTAYKLVPSAIGSVFEPSITKAKKQQQMVLSQQQQQLQYQSQASQNVSGGDVTPVQHIAPQQGVSQVNQQSGNWNDHQSMNVVPNHLHKGSILYTQFN